MSNIFESVTETLGVNKEGIADQASKLLDSHRDQIPDPIEGKIDEALHGGMLGGILDKVGLGGSHEEAKAEGDDEAEVTEESEETEEATEDAEETTEEDSEEDSEEEATEETEGTEDAEETEEDAEVEDN